MNKSELLAFLEKEVNLYLKRGVLESICRNIHMNEYDCEKIKQTTIEAILVDFINYVAQGQGIDYAMYTKDLKKD
jgi:hypothetical protein